MLLRLHKRNAAGEQRSTVCVTGVAQNRIVVGRINACPFYAFGHIAVSLFNPLPMVSGSIANPNGPATIVAHKHVQIPPK